MRKQSARSLFAASVAVVVACGLAGPSWVAFAHGPVTTLYFVRHGETQRRLRCDRHRHVRGGLYADAIVLRHTR